MGGLLEMEGEAGGLGTQAATGSERWDSGRDDATRGFKKSHDPSPAVMSVALAVGWTGVQWGGVGQMQGPARRPWQWESSLGLRRAWIRALGGRGRAAFGSGLTDKWDAKCPWERALRI